jgi:hypothetical protein
MISYNSGTYTNVLEASMDLLRVIIALLLLTILGQQALRSQGRPRRRWALSLAAGAFGIFALGSGLSLFGFNLTPIALPLFGLGLALMLASLVMLLRAWQAGEMRGQVEQMQQAIEEERRRRGSR